MPPPTLSIYSRYSKQSLTIAKTTLCTGQTTTNGKNYRVSNHTIAASNAKAYNYLGEQVRKKYHDSDEDVICITAGKTRIIAIYNDLKAGYKLDKRGYRLQEDGK